MEYLPAPRRGLLILAAALVLSLALQAAFALTPIRKMRKQDCFWMMFESDRLAAGQNPYSRILYDSMERGHYPTHLPLIYLAAAAPRRLGMISFAPRLNLLRFLNLLATLAVAHLLLRAGRRSAGSPWGVAVAVVWLLNFFTLYVQKVAQVDLIMVWLIALSVAARERNRSLAWFLLGVSLAVKHFGIFLVPLYLAEEKSVRGAAAGLAWCAAVPLAVSIPFLVWDARGLWVSIAYSGVRGGNNWFTYFLANEGFLGRFELLKALALVYLFAWRGRWPLAGAATLLYAFFYLLNPVIYQQYFVYGIFFLLLYVLTHRAPRRWIEDRLAQARRLLAGARPSGARA